MSDQHHVEVAVMGDDRPKVVRDFMHKRRAQMLTKSDRKDNDVALKAPVHHCFNLLK